jgi:hypothetical protein
VAGFLLGPRLFVRMLGFPIVLALVLAPHISRGAGVSVRIPASFRSWEISDS